MQTFTSINVDFTIIDANLHMLIFAYLFGGRKAGAAAARGKQAGRGQRKAAATAGANRAALRAAAQQGIANAEAAGRGRPAR